jgi:guanine deaminase
MSVAIEEANQGIDAHEGGPFGAVIVKDGVIIGRGHNRVIGKKDPTAHAEMEAIRDAAATLGDFDLSGAELFTTCAPCPMCLGAILWARLDKVHYCLLPEDVAAIGFDDVAFHQAMADKAFLEKYLLQDDAQRNECLKMLDNYCQSEHTEY